MTPKYNVDDLDVCDEKIFNNGSVLEFIGKVLPEETEEMQGNSESYRYDTIFSHKAKFSTNGETFVLQGYGVDNYGQPNERIDFIEIDGEQDYVWIGQWQFFVEIVIQGGETIQYAFVKSLEPAVREDDNRDYVLNSDRLYYKWEHDPRSARKYFIDFVPVQAIQNRVAVWRDPDVDSKCSFTKDRFYAVRDLFF